MRRPLTIGIRDLTIQCAAAHNIAVDSGKDKGQLGLCIAINVTTSCMNIRRNATINPWGTQQYAKGMRDKMQQHSIMLGR
jgi:hypothetical protein